MTIPKPYYRVKIGNQPEVSIFVSDEEMFARELRAMLNGRESLRGLGDDVGMRVFIIAPAKTQPMRSP